MVEIISSCRPGPSDSVSCISCGPIAQGIAQRWDRKASSAVHGYGGNSLRLYGQKRNDVVRKRLTGMNRGWTLLSGWLDS